MGVMKSERISQLSGSTSYCFVTAISLTVSSGGRIYMGDLLKKKSSFGVLPKELLRKQKRPDRTIQSVKDECDTRETNDPRCHLEFTVTRALGGDTIISPGN